MDVVINPCRLYGTAQAPPSKSYAHRALICAALAGSGAVKGIEYSNDISASLDCVNALGAEVEETEEAVKILSRGKATEHPVFNCRESGSTLRFFIPVAAALLDGAVFAGTPRLVERGIGIYENLFSQKGIKIEKSGTEIKITGRLTGGEYEIAGDISSQFATGLLLALPLVEGDSVLKITPPVVSRPYIDITLDVLKKYGVEIIEKEKNIFYIKGGQKYGETEMTVLGDWSNAAALLAFNCVGGKVAVTGLDENSVQGDRFCIEAFGMLEEENAVIDLSDCPDLAPVLFAVAAAKNGAVFTGTRRLAIKESDRASAMAEELEKFGVRTEVNENSVKIYACPLKTPGQVLSCHNDHRIVMALTLLASVTGGRISGAQAIEKSFPRYFETLKSLSAEVRIET
ncbi:MAG: 3-phosphoshikimate 1-carboxyvinyltransferase [Clostridia bacterium]|nr:3-phosphoshikimate 1-carboxyvinyltransferase [Clostridia bacterium]